MKDKPRLKELFPCILGSLIMAATIMLLKDLYALWKFEYQSVLRFWVDFVILTVLFIIHFRKHPRFLFKASLIFLACVCVLLSAAGLIWRQYYRSSVYPSLDGGKQQLYADKKVMVVVPHEDDDLNLMSGVLEEFVHYGSTVYPVFVSNGDHDVTAETRMREALSVMDRIGIPSENVIFLGYGDQYSEDSPHIYNAEPGQVVTSYSWHDATYGTEAHAVYREGRSYTSDHFLEDIHDVIWDYQPDILFCSDYDGHADHQAVSLAFEKAMGRLLKEHPEYRPSVFKGYAYAGAWNAASDFYAINLLSTQDGRSSPEIYNWEDRIRLPVRDGSLAHSLLRCETSLQLALHHSQNAFERADSIVNGDKVFWYRDTNSLCYQADIQVTSGNGTLLNNFMLLDSTNVVSLRHVPADGTWVPTDDKKEATVTFSEPRDIASIRLYDNPSADSNVLRCLLTFSDSTSLECGPLPAQGAAMTVPVDKHGITSFSVQLIETEGDQAGLTEIEAFSAQPEPGLRYVKLMDSDGNFMYDYCMTECDTMTIQTYCQGLTEEEIQSLTVQVDNARCAASIQNGVIELTCPKGSHTVLTLQLDGTDISDTVQVSHPGALSRRVQSLFRMLDKVLFTKYTTYLNDPVFYLRRSAVYKMLQPVLEHA